MNVSFPTTRKRVRRGVQTLESILVIPFLAMALAIMIQLGATMSVDEAVESAADEGAREAGKAVTTATMDSQIVDAAADAVNEVLSVHGLMVDATAGSGVRVIVNDNEDGGAVENLGDAGDSAVTQNKTFSSPGPGEVQVIVLVSFDAGSPNNDPIPNVLKTFGVDFTGKQLEVSSIAKKE